MACKYIVKNEKGEMVPCGEPEMIPGYCYDHTRTCLECDIEPANPETMMCEKCKKEQYS